MKTNKASRFLLTCIAVILSFSMTQCNNGKSKYLPIPIKQNMSALQGDAYQYMTDLTRRANNDFYVVLRNGSGAVSGNSYLLTMYYIDHRSYLDYEITTPGASNATVFKSFDNGQTFKVLHACGITDTQVEVIFNRDINASDAADKTLFMITGLTVSAAAAGSSANIVLLTTDAQGDDTGYTLTVGPSLRDASANALGGTGNTAAFKGFAATALPAVRDAYMCTASRIRIVYGNAAPGGTYSVYLRMNGVMRWLEDGSTTTYPNVLSIQNYGILVAMESLFSPSLPGYDSLVTFTREMGDNLIILGQPLAGRQGLDRRRSTDTFYLVKLYQVTGVTKYLDQAEFNFDNEINVNSFGGSTGGEAWAKQMIAQRFDLAGYDAGFYMYAALALASVNKSYPGAKTFATSCADYMIANESGWRDLAVPVYDTNRLSVGAFCFYLTELARIHSDTKATYSAKIAEYATEILSWQDASGFWGMSASSPDFDPQTMAFCLLALKGAAKGYGLDATAVETAIQKAEDYLLSGYVNIGTFSGGWYWNNDSSSGLYNEPVSELLWALSI